MTDETKTEVPESGQVSFDFMVLQEFDSNGDGVGTFCAEESVGKDFPK